MGNTPARAGTPTAAPRLREQEARLAQLSDCVATARQRAADLAAQAKLILDQAEQVEVEQITHGLRVGMTVYMRGLGFDWLCAGISHNTPLRVTGLAPADCTVVREDGGIFPVGRRGLAYVRLQRTNLRLWPSGVAGPQDEADDGAIREAYARYQALLKEGEALSSEAERQERQAAMCEDHWYAAQLHSGMVVLYYRERRGTFGPGGRMRIDRLGPKYAVVSPEAGVTFPWPYLGAKQLRVPRTRLRPADQESLPALRKDETGREPSAGPPGRDGNRAVTVTGPALHERTC